MFFALAFRFAECALRFNNCNRFAGDFGRVRGASDGSGGGQGKGVDSWAHGLIGAWGEVDLQGGCGTETSAHRAHSRAPLHLAGICNSRRQRSRWRIEPQIQETAALDALFEGPSMGKPLHGSRISSRILEMRRNIGTKLGTASRIISRLRLDVVADNKLPILDLGCGDGVFLEATAHVLRTRYPRRFPNPGALARVLRGVEIDPVVARQAEARLSNEFGVPPEGWDIRVGDALSMDEDESYDIIVGNPPWVRLHHLDAAVRTAARCNFRVATGTFDLAHLFVEKALRLLGPGGQLAFVVPRGIQVQPAAAKLRDLLSESGSWTVEPLAEDCFSPSAGIDAGLLTFLNGGLARLTDSPESGESVLGDIASVTTGIATGADTIFVVAEETVRRRKLEREALRPAIRGRDILPGQTRISDTEMRLIWPYREQHGRWVLRDLSAYRNVTAYLEEYKSVLTNRPRLSAAIERQPATWYRFIDPGRVGGEETRMVVADIFRSPAFATVSDPSAMVMNTCFQITPKPLCKGAVTKALQGGRFWEALRTSCRRLRNGYRRTSARELRQVPLDGTAVIV